MFWDLHVAYPGSKQQAKAIAAMAIQLGYDGIVWTRTVSSKLTPKEMNTMELPDMSEQWKSSGSQQSLLRLKHADYHAAAAAASGEEQKDGGGAAAASSSSTAAAASSSAIASPVVSSLPASSYGFQQKTRIHLVVEDASQLHSLNATNATLHSYDLVSVATTNEKLFHSCCSHESVDIVVIEAARKLPFYLKKPALNLALERGIHFEFSYAPAIRDSASRRALFSNLLSMLRLTRGRNLLFTSAAQREMEMRAPWDVINLGILCGIEPATAKASISASARSVLIHAEARKTIKCVLREVKLDEPSAASASSSAAGAHPKPVHTDEDTKHKNKKARTQNNNQGQQQQNKQ